MGKGKKSTGSRSKRPVSGHAESGANYTPPTNAGVSGILNGVPGPLLIVVSGIELVMGLVYIIVGSMNINDCKVEPLIPIWLIMMGVVLVLTAIHEYFHYFRRSSRTGHGRRIESLVITGILAALIIVFFIFGNVVVYSAWAAPPDYGHYWMENGCAHGTFNLAFISVIIMDALFGILLLAVLFFAVYQVCNGK